MYGILANLPSWAKLVQMTEPEKEKELHRLREGLDAMERMMAAKKRSMDGESWDYCQQARGFLVMAIELLSA